MTGSSSKTKAGGAGGAESKAETIAFEDATLIERCRSGDMQAFGLLVAKYQDRIFNTVLRMIGRRAEAEELAQETFLTALRKLSQFKGRSRFYTWLFRIATNLAISHLRRRGRLRFRSLDGPVRLGDDSDEVGGIEPAGVAQPGPADEVIAAERAERVRVALGELDDEYRLVVVLRDIEEMDYAAIADVLDIPVGTVKSRLHRGRTILKEKLADLVG